MGNERIDFIMKFDKDTEKITCTHNHEDLNVLYGLLALLIENIFIEYEWKYTVDDYPMFVGDFAERVHKYSDSVLEILITQTPNGTKIHEAFIEPAISIVPKMFWAIRWSHKLTGTGDEVGDIMQKIKTQVEQ